VPQDVFLFSDTVQGNIAFGKADIAREQAEFFAKSAAVHNDIMGLPKNYETLVGERGITLSGGQRQRAALGRALLVDAPILVLDDALASVDNNTAAEILRSIREQQGRTILMISHQLSAAAACDRILVLEDGKLVAEGHHDQLVNQPGTYRRLWERQQAEQQLEAV
jgi:ATP-binding cassette subfamily B protein